VSLRHPDAIGVIAIVVLGALTVYGGATTPDPGFGVVSPAAFPVVLGILMLASAAWLARDTIGAQVPALDPIDRRPFFATVAATGLFLVAFVPLGFVISSVVFFPVQSRILGSRSLVRDIVATALFVGAIYLLFVKFLTIDLPHGPLPSF
jgi:putative tricarboxylic transport membrane protein